MADVFLGLEVAMFSEDRLAAQPGSLDIEAACCFDCSGCRLLTAETDKLLKTTQ